MSDAVARPSASGFAPFDIDAEYVWVECDLPHYAGFKVEVRLNLKNRERKRLTTQLDEINAERERITESSRIRAKDLDERRAKALETGNDKAAAKLHAERFALIDEISAAFDANVQRIHALVAPYVRNWNVMDRDAEGNLIDAVPPAIGGVEAFEVLPEKLIGWVVSSVMGAYRGGKEWPTSLPSVAGSAPQPNEPSDKTPNDAPADSPS